MEHHNLSDLKLYLINAFAFSMSFAPIEWTLKIVSLLLAIGYTGRKWYLMEKSKKED